MKNERLLSLSSLLLLLLFCHPACAENEGLYWQLGEGSSILPPEKHFPYDAEAPYLGAVEALKYGCSVNPGTAAGGSWTGIVRIDTGGANFPAKKGGHCMNRYSLLPNPMPGNYYLAYLYCNGERLPQNTENPVCEAPPAEKTLPQNFGPSCPLSF